MEQIKINVFTTGEKKSVTHEPIAKVKLIEIASSLDSSQ
jgi:hypothetical protein